MRLANLLSSRSAPTKRMPSDRGHADRMGLARRMTRGACPRLYRAGSQCGCANLRAPTATTAASRQFEGAQLPRRLCCGRQTVSSGTVEENPVHLGSQPPRVEHPSPTDTPSSRPTAGGGRAAPERGANAEGGGRGLIPSLSGAPVMVPNQVGAAPARHAELILREHHAPRAACGGAG